VTITSENLQQLRDRDIPLPPVEDCGVDWHERQITGAGGPISVRIYRPREATGALGCIFHIHGGGYVGGKLGEFEFLHRPLAAELNCTIVTVDYRLAPETAFPGNIEDCYAALAWTFASAGELQIDRKRIGVMGESAGGGLAAALALLARDRRKHSLAFQHLIYPMLDDRTCLREPNPHAGEFIWHSTNNHFGWKSLLGAEPGGPDISPYAAPARATDLGGLPPTFIGTGALDLFVDEDIDYAARLIRAGIPTELHVWAGAFHGFDLVPGPRVADAAHRTSHDALRRFLESRP
jgi:acetyl esterase/lipase